MTVFSSMEALSILASYRTDEIIISTMTTARQWESISAKDIDVPFVGCMSKASSFGLGLALARPDRKMVVLDGDGGLLMNLGSLVTIANMAPANLVHFVFENGVYRTSGGQPIPGKLKVDFAAMAKDAGFEKVYTFSNGEDFSSNVKQILHEKGPTFVYLKVAVHVEEKLPPFPTRTTADCFRHLKKALA